MTIIVAEMLVVGKAPCTWGLLMVFLFFLVFLVMSTRGVIALVTLLLQSIRMKYT
jgi:hypothetical protein